MSKGRVTQFLLHLRPFDVTEGIFAALYVSIMGLTRFYKTTFLHLFAVFLLNVKDIGPIVSHRTSSRSVKQKTAVWELLPF